MLIFDLDNTLHDAQKHVFPHLDRAMTDYVARHLELPPAAASELQRDYWLRYGATLKGLMKHHGTDPHHFLRETHPIDGLEAMLVTHPALTQALKRAPQRKLLFSNSPRHYAMAVLKLLGVTHVFDAVFCIEQTGFRPKPERYGFTRLLARERLCARHCVMIDDAAANLRAAKAVGLNTIWLSARWVRPAFVDARLSSMGHLARYLARLR